MTLGQLEIYILWILPDVSDVLPEIHPLNQFNVNSIYKTNSYMHLNTYTTDVQNLLRFSAF